MPQFNLQDYEQVKDRVKAFHAKYEDGRIITTLLSDPIDIKVATFKAEVYLGDILKATGHAFEVPGANANKFSHLENSETSAVGRALANMGLHGDKRPSREEMDKVNRGSTQQLPLNPNISAQRLRAIDMIKASGHDIIQAQADYNKAKEAGACQEALDILECHVYSLTDNN
jgi:hypothetical protein